MSRIQGNRYEDLAVDWIRAQGWVVVERNWCCQFGEIDIVAQIIDSTDVGQRGEVIVFEVKGRHKHSEWTESLLSNRKKKALHLSIVEWFHRLEMGQVEIPLPMSGIQFALLRVVEEQIEIIWNAMDIEMG